MTIFNLVYSFIFS